MNDIKTRLTPLDKQFVSGAGLQHTPDGASCMSASNHVEQKI